MEPLRPSDPVRIGPFALAARLGEGGMGAVFLGRSSAGLDAAIKVVAADPESRSRFHDELMSLQRVRGICTARFIDADLDARQPWLATEYVPGHTLGEAVRFSGALAEPAWSALALGLAEALTTIHGAGLLHRDLKPSNVILSPTGPRVVDFGIARLIAAERRTAVGLVIGTPGWMAPEQLAAEPLSAAIDLYGVGLLLGFAGTGRAPYGEGSLEEVGTRVMAGDADLQGLTPRQREIVTRLLSRDPGLRGTPATLAESVAAGSSAELERSTAVFLARSWETPAGDHRTRLLAAPTAPMPTQRQRFPGLAAAAAVLVVIVAAALAVVLTSDSGGGKPAAAPPVVASPAAAFSDPPSEPPTVAGLTASTAQLRAAEAMIADPNSALAPQQAAVSSALATLQDEFNDTQQAGSSEPADCAAVANGLDRVEADAVHVNTATVDLNTGITRLARAVALTNALSNRTTDLASEFASLEPSAGATPDVGDETSQAGTAVTTAQGTVNTAQQQSASAAGTVASLLGQAQQLLANCH